jgi:hypothetical protein
MIPLLIGAGLGTLFGKILFAGASGDNQKSLPSSLERDLKNGNYVYDRAFDDNQKSLHRAASSVERDLRNGNFDERTGLLDTNTDETDEIPDWIRDLANMEDDNRVPFIFFRDEDDFKAGYYQPTNNGVYSLDDEKFTRPEKRIIRDSLEDENYEVWDLGEDGCIRIIGAEE